MAEISELSQLGLLSLSLVSVYHICYLFFLYVKVHILFLAVLIICPCKTNLGNGRQSFCVIIVWWCLPTPFPRTLYPKLRHLLGFLCKCAVPFLLLLQSLDTLGAPYAQG